MLDASGVGVCGVLAPACNKILAAEVTPQITIIEK